MPVRGAFTPQAINQFFQPRIRSWLLTILVALAPALISVILVTSKAKLADFMPVWNDEVSYWHQVLTFKSHYLLLDDRDYAGIVARENAPQLGFLAKTALGSLYRNLSAGCG